MFTLTDLSKLPNSTQGDKILDVINSFIKSLNRSGRHIFQAYHIQELLFNLMYSPHNFYCYVLDRKASSRFREQMRNLSNCFPNVMVSDIEYVMNRQGHNRTRGFLECLKLLIVIPDWKYALLLQVFQSVFTYTGKIRFFSLGIQSSSSSCKKWKAGFLTVSLFSKYRQCNSMWNYFC